MLVEKANPLSIKKKKLKNDILSWGPKEML